MTAGARRDPAIALRRWGIRKVSHDRSSGTRSCSRGDTEWKPTAPTHCRRRAGRSNGTTSLAPAHRSSSPRGRHSFAARLSLGRLGPIQFVRMSTNRTDIRRTAATSSRRARCTVPAPGARHSGVPALRPGSAPRRRRLTLCDSAAPPQFLGRRQQHGDHGRVDGATLKEHLATPERFCGCACGTRSG